MIVVDASALLAILLEEPEKAVFIAALARSDATMLSPIGYWEAAVNMRKYREQGGVDDLDRLIALFAVSQYPITAHTSQAAFAAHARFGRGTPAKLNLGDCFAYALARELNAPLLYKGDDFSRTDIQSATAA